MDGMGKGADETPDVHARTRSGLRGIGARLALATVGVLVVVSSALYLELTRRERQSLLSAKSVAASMVADLFAASLVAPLDFADQDAIDNELRHLETNSEVICAAIWLEGDERPVAVMKNASQGTCDASRPIVSRDVAAPVFRDDAVEVVRLVTGRKGKSVGRTRVVFSLVRENTAFATSRARIFGLSAALALGTALLLLAITRRQIVLPLARLAAATVRVGRGDLAARVAVRSDDEIGQLAGAFNRMSEALSDRDRQLSAVTQHLRELLDHMRQAILAFDREGRVQGEASHQARAIFGDSLAGTSVSDLLYPGAATHDVESQSFIEWRETAFDVVPADWQQIEEFAPRELTIARADGTTVPLEVEFRPIGAGDRVERIMLLATDVSEKRRLERTVEAQSAEHARRMGAMRRLAAGGAQLFVSFAEKAREELGECLSRLGPQPSVMSRPDIDALFRRIHTMRGEARAFELLELDRDLTVVEDELSGLREIARVDGSAFTGAGHARLVQALHRADDAVLDAREGFVSASPIGRAVLDQMTVQRSDVEELAALLSTRAEPAEKRVLDRLMARRFGETAATLLERARDWAGTMDKEVHLELEGRDVPIPPAVARILGGVLVHLVRNAIVHGIESPGVRADAGKEPRGRVTISASSGPSGPTVFVEDDGRGLDTAAIVARARGLGLNADRPAHELVFEPGLSTLEECFELAGRGVGLDAVRTELAAVGYSVSIETAPGRGTKYVLSPLGAR